jgi:hypothetical protein
MDGTNDSFENQPMLEGEKIGAVRMGGLSSYYSNMAGCTLSLNKPLHFTEPIILICEDLMVSAYLGGNHFAWLFR